MREIRVRVVVCVDLAGKSGGPKDSGEDESACNFREATLISFLGNGLVKGTVRGDEWTGEGGASGPPKTREWTGNRMFLTQNELGELERFLPCENAAGRQYSDRTPTGSVERARV